MAVVQALCTASTKALYWQYKGFVPMIQKMCTTVKRYGNEYKERYMAFNEQIEAVATNFFLPKKCCHG